MREQASIRALRGALALASHPHTRQVLCDVLGFRHARSALPLLIGCLADDAPKVRSSAADALGKIGDGRAGAPLLERFLAEQVASVRDTIAYALGSVGYQAAVPALVAALHDAHWTVRGGAAWSLGVLRAADSLTDLKIALLREATPQVRARLGEAIGRIQAPG